jgi:hypothetical protein
MMNSDPFKESNGCDGIGLAMTSRLYEDVSDNFSSSYWPIRRISDSSDKNIFLSHLFLR